MIGVTIGVGDFYATLAAYAALALGEMTGLKTVILGDEHFAASGLPFPHFLKLRIFDLVDSESVLYFDADMVCLNRWNPVRFENTQSLVAVAERRHHTVIQACSQWQIPLDEYINTGFLILHRSVHNEWLQETERFVADRYHSPGPGHTIDQTPLNIVRHQLELPLKLLDRRYNWIGFGKGPLCYQVPVFMAHAISLASKSVNIDFFEKRYQPPFHWTINVNESATEGLQNQIVQVEGRRKRGNIHLGSDRTVGTSDPPLRGRYWFIFNAPDGPRLAITSDTEILREFVPSGTKWKTANDMLVTAVNEMPTPPLDWPDNCDFPDPEILGSYEGIYDVPRLGIQIAISSKTQRLYAKSDRLGPDSQELVPESNTQFFLLQSNLVFNFQHDESSRSTKIVIWRGSDSLQANKIRSE